MLTLHEETQRYKSMIENHPYPVFTFDTDGRFTTMNPAGERFTGYTIDELIGMSYHEFIDAEMLEVVNQHFQKTIHGEPQQYECLLHTRTEQARWVDVTNIPIKIGSQIRGVYGVAKDITIDKEREQSLHATRAELTQSEFRFRDLMDIAPIGIVIHQNERIVYVNDEAKRIVKAGDDPILGSCIYDFIAPVHQELTQERMTNPALRKTLPVISMQFTCVNGDIIDVEVSSQHIKFKDGLATMALFTDITKRKFQEQTLHVEKQKLDSLFNNAQDAVSILDLQGSILRVNPAWEAMYGWLQAEVIGKCNPNFRPERLREMSRFILQNHKSIPPYEVAICRKDGTQLLVSASVYPLHDIDGNVIGMVVNMRDITAHKEAERKLRESEQRYRLIAENTLDIIRVVNPEGIVTFASPSHRSVLGFEPYEFVGKSHLYKVDQNDVLIMKNSFEISRSTRKPFTCEVRYTHQDGTYVWGESTGAPVFNELGKIVEFVVIIRDISERKRYEQQLEFLAYHDSLTGLPNGRLFLGTVTQAIEDAQRNNDKLAVMYMDCDKFKQINDRYGHDVGDEVIKTFGRRIEASIRESDCVCRIGGDEFLVLLPKISSEGEAADVAMRIFNAVNTPWKLSAGILQITASIGMATYPKDAIEASNLVKCADKALYQAKEEGRNTFRFY